MSAGTTVRLDIANEAQMHAVAANIACATRPGLVLTLAGPLAAGKTSFARWEKAGA